MCNTGVPSETLQDSEDFLPWLHVRCKALRKEGLALR